MAHPAPALLAIAAVLIAGAVRAPRWTRSPGSARTALLYLAFVHLAIAFSLLTSPGLANGVGALVLLTFPAMLLIIPVQPLASLFTSSGQAYDYLVFVWLALINACLVALLAYAIEHAPPSRRNVPRGTLR